MKTITAKIFVFSFFFVMFLSISTIPSVKADTKKYPSNLVAYWKFEDSSTSKADDSANDYTAIIKGGASKEDTTSNAPSVLEYKVISLDGIDGYLEVADSSDLDLTTFTVMAWVKFNDLAGFQSVIAKAGDGVSKSAGWGLTLDAGKLSFYCYISGIGWVKSFITTSTLYIDTWYFVVGTLDSSNCKLYISGQEETSIDISGGSGLVLSPDVLSIGRFYTEQAESTLGNRGHLNGEVDEIAIFNEALSSADIQDIYQNGVPYSTPKEKQVVSKNIDWMFIIAMIITISLVAIALISLAIAMRRVKNERKSTSTPRKKSQAKGKMPR